MVTRRRLSQIAARRRFLIKIVDDSLNWRCVNSDLEFTMLKFSEDCDKILSDIVHISGIINQIILVSLLKTIKKYFSNERHDSEILTNTCIILVEVVQNVIQHSTNDRTNSEPVVPSLDSDHRDPTGFGEAECGIRVSHLESGRVMVEVVSNLPEKRAVEIDETIRSTLRRNKNEIESAFLERIFSESWSRRRYISANSLLYIALCARYGIKFSHSSSENGRVFCRFRAVIGKNEDFSTPSQEN